jgi:hypothetical protein
MSADMRRGARPSLRAEPKLQPRSVATPPGPRGQRSLWPRLIGLMTLIGFALTVAGFAYTVYGPPWPTEPTFEPALASSGSAFDVSFSGTNKSGFFDNTNLRVSCTVICLKYTGPTGATIAMPKGPVLNIIGTGPNRLLAGQTLPFFCSIRHFARVDGSDVADVRPTVAISFTSEYDDPWWLWFRRKTARSETFSLNTKAVPPQWVRGEIPGLCDF